MSYWSPSIGAEDIDDILPYSQARSRLVFLIIKQVRIVSKVLLLQADSVPFFLPFFEFCRGYHLQ